MAKQGTLKFKIRNVTVQDIKEVYKPLVANRPYVGLNSRYTYLLWQKTSKLHAWLQSMMGKSLRSPQDTFHQPDLTRSLAGKWSLTKTSVVTVYKSGCFYIRFKLQMLHILRGPLTLRTKSPKTTSAK